MTHSGKTLAAVSSIAYDGSLIYLAIGDTATIPAGRTLEKLSWVLDDGTTQVAFEGMPDKITTETNVSGTYEEATVNATAAGLTGTASITLTLMDSTGRISTATDSLNL